MVKFMVGFFAEVNKDSLPLYLHMRLDGHLILNILLAFLTYYYHYNTHLREENIEHAEKSLLLLHNSFFTVAPGMIEDLVYSQFSVSTGTVPGFPQEPALKCPYFGRE